MKKTVSISVDFVTWNAFKELSHDRRTTPSAFIERLIRSELKGEKQVHKAVEEIRDAFGGRTDDDIIAEAQSKLEIIRGNQ